MFTFDTPAPIGATIEFAVGAVHLQAAAVDTTTVEVRPTDPANPDDVETADDTIVELDGDRLTVRGPHRQGLGMVRYWLSRGQGGSVDATITVPTGSSLEVSLGAGDVTGDGTFGDCNVRTGLGAIRLEATEDVDVKSGAGALRINHVDGRADLTTASGRVDLGTVTGSTVVRNSNGLTRIGAVDGHLRVKSANGVIDVGTAHGDVVAKSANGDVRVDEVVQGSVVLETHVGDVEVGIREGTAAWLDLDATAGSVHNDLETSDKPASTADAVKVRARTTLGAIVIRRPQESSHA